MSPFGGGGGGGTSFLSETWHWENFVDGSIILSPHFSFVRLIVQCSADRISSHNLMYLCASESRFCLTQVMSKLAIVKSQDTLDIKYVEKRRILLGAFLLDAKSSCIRYFLWNNAY